MTPTWSDGTPKSTNNAFTLPKRRKSRQKTALAKFRLKRHEQALCSVMTPEEVTVYRLKIKQERGIL